MNVSVDKPHEVSAAFIEVALMCFYDFSIIRIVTAINGSFSQGENNVLLPSVGLSIVGAHSVCLITRPFSSSARAMEKRKHYQTVLQYTKE